MQGKIELKNGAYTGYVSISGNCSRCPTSDIHAVVSSILTPQCALQGDLEQALIGSYQRNIRHCVIKVWRLLPSFLLPSEKSYFLLRIEFSRND